MFHDRALFMQMQKKKYEGKWLTMNDDKANMERT